MDVPRSHVKYWVAGAVAAMMLGAVLNDTDQPSTAGYVAPPVVVAAPTTKVPPPCPIDPGPYTGQDECNQTGEVATVGAVFDSASFRTVDGRTVRLLGVEPVSDCGGDRATAYLRRLIDQKPVMLFTEPGKDKDGKGKLLRYVKYIEDPVNTPGRYTTDVGYAVVEAGFGRPDDGPNERYLSWLEIGVTLGRAKHEAEVGRAEYQGGQVDTCQRPTEEPPTDDSSDSADVDVDVDAPDVDRPNLPDGALTGGFCRKKWWC